MDRLGKKPRRKVRFEKFLLSMVNIPEENIAKAKSLSTLYKTQEEVLVDLNDITEIQFAELAGIYSGIEVLELDEIKPSELAKEVLPKDVAQKHDAFPLEVTDDTIKVAMFNPLNGMSLNAIRLVTQRTVIPVIAIRGEIKNAILNHYTTSKKIEEALDAQSTHRPVVKKSNTIMADGSTDQEDAPVVKLVNSIIEEAADRKASDIHFDPLDNEMLVRIRIDGVLVDLMHVNVSVMPQLVSRIKIMSDLNISETRLPQDGRVRIQTSSHLLDLRISCLPTIFGEKVVMRLLDLSKGSTDLMSLGFTNKNLNSVMENVKAPYGLILVTGPTGSGKTSTLYSMIKEVNKPETNIITVEDPVEQQIEGINQVQVNEQIDLTFATGLRSILRQDPNVIMVGEIRDMPTASMAIEASLTGHLVLSTLHTNDAVGAIIRLIDMGVAPFLVSNALSAVVAQRLVRRVCQHCAKKVPLTPIEIELFEKYGMKCTHQQKGVGCSYCHQSGYVGRIAIQEVLEMTSVLRTLITTDVDTTQLQETALSQGLESMFIDGLKKVVTGQTTLEEILLAVKEYD